MTLKLIRKIYIYIALLIGLILIIIGSVQLIDIGLKKFIFTKADEPLMYPYPPAPFSKETTISKEELEKQQLKQLEFERQNLERERQRKLTNSLSFVLVGSIVFILHWYLSKKEEN